MSKPRPQVYTRTIALIAALAGGIILPQASKLSFLISYLIQIMLFFSFLDVNFNWASFKPRAFLVFLANILIPFAGYLILLPVSKELALTAFMTGITPTATAAPVIMGFLKGSVEYVIVISLLTNIGISLLLPLFIPLVTGAVIVVSSWEVLKSVLSIIFLPLLLSRIVPLLPSPLQKGIRFARPAAFPLWLFSLFLITARAVAFIIEDTTLSLPRLLSIALISLAVCIINFSLGALIGGKKYKRESSQALGQKNTSFTIWLSLAFISPLVAMGPAFYVIFHNLYNSYQLYRFQKKEKES